MHHRLSTIYFGRGGMIFNSFIHSTKTESTHTVPCSVLDNGNREVHPLLWDVHWRKQGLDSRANRWLSSQMNSSTQPGVMACRPCQGDFLSGHCGASRIVLVYSYLHHFTYLVFACGICSPYVQMTKDGRNLEDGLWITVDRSPTGTDRLKRWGDGASPFR